MSNNKKDFETDRALGSRDSLGGALSWAFPTALTVSLTWLCFAGSWQLGPVPVYSSMSAILKFPAPSPASAHKEPRGLAWAQSNHIPMKSKDSPISCKSVPAHCFDACSDACFHAVTYHAGDVPNLRCAHHTCSVALVLALPSGPCPRSKRTPVKVMAPGLQSNTKMDE